MLTEVIPEMGQTLYEELRDVTSRLSYNADNLWTCARRIEELDADSAEQILDVVTYMNFAIDGLLAVTGLSCAEMGIDEYEE